MTEILSLELTNPEAFNEFDIEYSPSISQANKIGRDSKALSMGKLRIVLSKEYHKVVLKLNYADMSDYKYKVYFEFFEIEFHWDENVVTKRKLLKIPEYDDLVKNYVHLHQVKSPMELKAFIDDKLKVFFNEKLKWLLLVEEGGYYLHNLHLNGIYPIYKAGRGDYVNTTATDQFYIEILNCNMISSKRPSILKRDFVILSVKKKVFKFKILRFAVQHSRHSTFVIFKVNDNQSLLEKSLRENHYNAHVEFQIERNTQRRIYYILENVLRYNYFSNNSMLNPIYYAFNPMFEVEKVKNNRIKEPLFMVENNQNYFKMKKIDLSKMWEKLDFECENNTDMAAVVKHITLGFHRPYPYLVKGHFGTGKTSVIILTLKFIYFNYYLEFKDKEYGVKKPKILVLSQNYDAMLEMGKLIHNSVLIDKGIQKEERKKLFKIVSYKQVKDPELKEYASGDLEDDIIDMPFVLSTVDNSFKIYEYEIKQTYDYVLIDDANYMLEYEYAIPISLYCNINFYNTSIVLLGNHRHRFNRLFTNYSKELECEQQVFKNLNRKGSVYLNEDKIRKELMKNKGEIIENYGDHHWMKYIDENEISFSYYLNTYLRFSEDLSRVINKLTKSNLKTCYIENKKLMMTEYYKKWHQSNKITTHSLIGDREWFKEERVIKELFSVLTDLTNLCKTNISPNDVGIIVMNDKYLYATEKLLQNWNLNFTVGDPHSYISNERLITVILTFYDEEIRYVEYVSNFCTSLSRTVDCAHVFGYKMDNNFRAIYRIIENTEDE